MTRPSLRGASIAAAVAGLLVGVSVAVGAWIAEPVGSPEPLLAAAIYTPPGRGFGAAPEAFWVRANFHSHSKHGVKGVGDDGRSIPQTMHEVYEGLGYDFSVHTPHSSRNKKTARARGRWLALKEHEELALDAALTMPRSVGLELSVAKGPNYRHLSHRRYGKGVFRTLNHTLIFGADEYIPHLTRMKSAAELSHVYGGVLLVAHPVLWERDYFTRPGLLDKIDGIEVLNGIVLVKTGEDEEDVYLDATAYSGGNARLAAIGGTDSHGLAWVKEVVTYVRTTANDVEGIVQAIRQRRTYVTRGFFDLELKLPQLGRIIRSGEVSLDLDFNRQIDVVELRREGELAGRWVDVNRVRFREQIAENAAYVFSFRAGAERGVTSAVWYEPQPERLPDLVVPADRIEVRGRQLRAVVRNAGDAEARFVHVAIYSKLPFKRGTRPSRTVTIERLGPGEEASVEATFKKKPKLVYVKADPESYARAVDNDAIQESDERNNAALKVLRGEARKRLDRALVLRARRAARRARPGADRRIGGRRRARVDVSLLPDYVPGEEPELDEHEE